MSKKKRYASLDIIGWWNSLPKNSARPEEVWAIAEETFGTPKVWYPLNGLVDTTRQ